MIYYPLTKKQRMDACKNCVYAVGRSSCGQCFDESEQSEVDDLEPGELTDEEVDKIADDYHDKIAIRADKRHP